ncbi:Transcription factor GTE10 [Platanthera zijinensis]|uniref:Transcription factor GTE10 n=1 Tax=Platanthera zijinensis TaxID=2320716 RepID=A0AAP0BFA5_9ASPA
MGKTVEKKRKKKGRPSLLDLQKRSLRLQKQHEQQPHLKHNSNPSTNPYARFPNPPADRRPARRNPNPEPDPPSLRVRVDDATAAVLVEDEEDEPTERRKEKKLKLVHHLPHADANFSDATYYASESDAAEPKKRKFTVRKEGKTSSKTAVDTQGKRSDLGPTTPLPDKHLLEFILDRLQKKDTYGVFSGPVDPDELPDYHDIIKHPMDFETVRNRLSSGVYTNLEQFEKDVFLISLNAMRYNASDTIYFRQARSIHELAKKDFENLRQESDDSGPEPKIVRRGRPPGTGKDNFKQSVGKPPAETALSEYKFEACLANTVNKNFISNPCYDFLGKGMALHKPGMTDVFGRAARCAQSSEAYILSTENKLVANEDFSESGWRGSSNSGKNVFSTDENRRDAYKQYPLSTPEFPLLTSFNGDRKNLVPVALHMEHAYASSLARFAANLGPIGWKLASIRIRKALPPGTKFGPGWVGKGDPQPSQRSLMFSTPILHHSSVLSDISTASTGEKLPEKQEELSLNESTKLEYQIGTHLPSILPSLSAVSPDKLPDANEVRPYSKFCQIPFPRPTSYGFKAPFT